MQHRRYLYLITLLLSTVFTACSHDDGTGDSNISENSISFQNIDEAKTRAVNTLATKNNVYDFLVHTVKVMQGGSTQTVMDQYKVVWEALSWVYEGQGDGQFLKYWDKSAAKYRFSGVAPAPDPTSAKTGFGDVTASFDDDGKVSLSGVHGNLSAAVDLKAGETAAPDWMVARTVRRGINDASTLLDYDDIAENIVEIDTMNTPASKVFSKPQTVIAEVPMNFHHIFAKVDFKAFAVEDGMKLKGLKIYIPKYDNDFMPTTGDYKESGWDVTSAKDTVFTEIDFGEKPIRLYTTAEKAELIASRLEIPHAWMTQSAEPGQEAVRTLKVVCKIGDDEYNGTLTLTKENNGAYTESSDTSGWQQNVHYTYILKIDNTSSEKDVILFSVDMEKWKWQQGNSLEDKETNW